MISRNLNLKLGYTNSVVDEIVNIYIYDKNIKFFVYIVEHDLRFGSTNSGSDFIPTNNIVTAKAYFKSPVGKIFYGEEVEVDNKLVTFIIRDDMINNEQSIGEWQVQIKLTDSDGSFIHLHPFKFYVKDLAVKTGNSDFDSNDDNDLYEPEKNNVLDDKYFNGIEDKLSDAYSTDMFKKELIEYETENKTTISAINELFSLYTKIQQTFNELSNGTLDIDKYIEENGLVRKTGLLTSVSITNKENNILSVGSSLTYRFKITPSFTNRYKYVKWESSNTSVAKISATGRVTAISPGTTFITIYSKDNGSLYDRIKLTVI